MEPQDDEFRPEKVDELIDEFFHAPSSQIDPRQQLIHDLYRMRKLSPEEEAHALQRVWERVRVPREQTLPEGQDLDITQELPAVIRQRRQQQRNDVSSSRMRAVLRPLVAVVLVTLLLGSFIVSLNLMHANKNAAVAPTVVSIVPTVVRATPTSLPIPSPTNSQQGQPTPTSLPQPTPTSLPQPTPTSTAATTVPLKPVAECITLHTDGTYTATFGYLNPNAFDVTIPAGQKNFFAPSPIDRGQVTTFKPGRQRAAFQVDVAGGALTWFLDGGSGTVSLQSHAC